MSTRPPKFMLVRDGGSLIGYTNTVGQAVKFLMRSKYKLAIVYEVTWERPSYWLVHEPRKVASKSEVFVYSVDP